MDSIVTGGVMRKFYCLAILCGLFTVGCATDRNVYGKIVGEERASFLSEVEPRVDEILAGLNEGDYEKFSRWFDDEMKLANPPAAFEQRRELLQSRMGLYESRVAGELVKRGPYIFVTYQSRFERRSGVLIGVAFKKYERSFLISGFKIEPPVVIRRRGRRR